MSVLFFSLGQKRLENIHYFTIPFALQVWFYNYNVYHSSVVALVLISPLVYKKYAERRADESYKSSE
ncbi:MAG: hypothetical protein CO186_09990 [Zetaproteobacteria bacterium CG_4_9_14_3_um_filter_49_83]|nr:MAG: hypothetical protein AUJ56_07265 [Zetaproteobacteria bacterium CG1_02_49_23]PIV29406.1 MAG: hypothetical protein COS35_12115 [Zetaproteobacteria bacterium CG02_land_8_20_14_3_00_50_9]PIY56566.1 MAG: hypothetical protein COZ00_03430 [Zetaproteobacteria bacterium CG_4_10_14_0_8_um_filter_49_80]PJA34619.1 MAG: hypothetical protein CO186_09990 [Zetaproteobacteria bacterium CG_4_9_14_3_um_filter_49_83]